MRYVYLVKLDSGPQKTFLSFKTAKVWGGSKQSRQVWRKPLNAFNECGWDVPTYIYTSETLIDGVWQMERF